MRFSFVMASLLVVGCALSCSSASFQVAQPGDSGGTDSGDGGVDPCAPVDGIAKFCVTVNPTSHPGYDASTGAASLGLDGQGTLSLLLFNQDPVANPKTTPTVITYPPNGTPASLDIDKDFPVTFAGPVTTGGTYWFVAIFEDDTTTVRDLSKADSSLPGDFVTVPTYDASYALKVPQVTLSVGSTQTQSLDIHPVRRIIADLRPSAKFIATHTANPSIHGDGPTAFLLYDGNIETKDGLSIYGVAGGRCVALFSDPPPTYPIQVPFNTIIDGSHKILAVLYDYAVPDKGFPGKGTILSPTHDVPPDELVSVVNPGSAWSTEVEVAMSQVPDPYTEATAPPDTLTCP